MSSSSKLDIGNLVRKFFAYLIYKYRQQQRQEGIRGEDAQQDDISITISTRAPTTTSAPSPQAGSAATPSTGEFTVYIRPHESLGIHQACVWKLAGRDEDEIRSVFEIGAAESKIENGKP